MSSEGCRAQAAARQLRLACRVLLALPALLAVAAPAQAGGGPVVQAWTLDNGARVLFVESRDLPILDVAVDFRAGSAFDPADRSGLAAMTQHLARFGAGGGRGATMGSGRGGRLGSEDIGGRGM